MIHEGIGKFKDFSNKKCGLLSKKGQNLFLRDSALFC